MEGILRLLLGTIVINLFSFMTILIRPKIYGVKLFKPMIWNMKLSILPPMSLFVGEMIGIGIVYLTVILNNNIFYYFGLVVSAASVLIWLILLPNSAYLITELNMTHRDEDTKEVPLWYDIISVLSLALSGIVNTILSIAILQVTTLIYMDSSSLSSSNHAFLFAMSLVIVVLVSIGIYFGREIRFNSWDILHPVSLVRTTIKHLSVDGEMKNFILFIVFYTIFLMIVYLLLGVPFYFL